MAEGDKEVEVKARELQYSIATGHAVMHGAGMPAFQTYTYYQKNDWGVEEQEGLPNADEAAGEDRMFVNPGYQDATGIIREGILDA